jgi:catalase
LSASGGAQQFDLFRLMTPDQKDQLFDNIKAAMDGIPLEIIKRQLVTSASRHAWD